MESNAKADEVRYHTGDSVWKVGGLFTGARDMLVIGLTRKAQPWQSSPHSPVSHLHTTSPRLSTINSQPSTS